MSLATDKDDCRRQHSNSTQRMQHQPGKGLRHSNSIPPAEVSNIVIVRITYSELTSIPNVIVSRRLAWHMQVALSVLLPQQNRARGHTSSMSFLTWSIPAYALGRD